MEASVRRGDVYALMIQQCIKLGKYDEAKQLFFELRQMLSSTSTPITYYVSKEAVEALAQGLGVSGTALLPAVSKVPEEVQGEDVEEDIPEM